MRTNLSSGFTQSTTTKARWMWSTLWESRDLSKTPWTDKWWKKSTFKTLEVLSLWIEEQSLGVTELRGLNTEGGAITSSRVTHMEVPPPTSSLQTTGWGGGGYTRAGGSLGGMEERGGGGQTEGYWGLVVNPACSFQWPFASFCLLWSKSEGFKSVAW